MNFILNERSLYGQFGCVEEFLKSLGANLQCFHLVRNQEEGENRKIALQRNCALGI